MDFLIKKKNNKISNYFLYYIIPFTVAFLLLQFIVYLPFGESGRSFIWDMDGINQHYPSLVYYSNLLKDLINGRGFPMVDFNVGMGFDTLTTLNYYAIGDPLTLLTIFGADGNMEGIYRFLILLRFYLSGVSFIMYCIYRKKKGFPSVLGGLIYVFCGYVFYAGTRHPYFTNPMIYLPLLFIGVDRIIRKKKPYLFVIMTCISALSNFYFFYMLTVLILIYAIIRFFYTYDKSNPEPVWKLFFRTAFRTGLYYTLGVVMSAIILLPVLAAFYNNGRFNGGYQVNLLYYDLSYYVLMVNSFIAPNITAGFWTQCTFAAIVPAAVWMVFRNRKNRELMLGFILATVSLMLPFVGYFMNGMAYVSNRWEFGYSFLLAFIVTAVYDDMFSLVKTDKIILLAGTGIYGILGLLKPSKYVLLAFLILCATVLCILFFNNFKKSPYFQRTVIFILVFCNLAINGYLTYSVRFGNYVGEFIPSDQVRKTIGNSAVALAAGLVDDSFYRVETFGDKWLNEALTVGYHDVSGYFSIMDKRVAEYMKGLELLSLRATYRFDNLDCRTGIGTLAGVKYLVSPYKAAVPYGYQVLKEQRLNGRTYYLFENQYALPLGYTYDRYITRDVYENLNALQKQEIMLQAVVLEEPVKSFKGILPDGEEDGNAAGNPVNFLSKKLPVTIQFGQGISWEGDYLNVTAPGAKLTLYFDGLKDSETYLRFENFDINDTDYYAMNFKVKGEGEVTKTVNVRSNRNNAYFGKDDCLVNLGYQAKAMGYCIIGFPQIGRFHLSGLEVYTLPMDNYGKQVQERKIGALENIVVQNNRITGTVNSDKDSILCLSIPYSKGWSAYVNGTKQELLQANVMYMALPVKAGRNEIKLSYETPFLKAGGAMTVTGWFVFICIIIFNRVKAVKSGKS